MRPVSDRLLRTLRGSHKMRTRARVVEAGQTGTNPDGVVIPILAGNVDYDASADIRATLDLTTDGTNMWPSSASSLLAPYGNEVFVERGVEFGDGITEWVSQGYYRINTPEQDIVPDGPIRLAAQDRNAGLIDGRLTAPVQFPATLTRAQVVSVLITDVYPWATIEWDEPAVGDLVIGRAMICEEDRFGFLRDLLTSAGRYGYWDHRGVFVIRTPPPVTAPVWTVDQGRNGVLIRMARDLSREGIYNGVLATGEAADTKLPARALAVDSNPASPTYWYGAFGKVPRFYSSPFLVTNAQALSAASAILQRSLGAPYNVNFGTIANPGLEPYDPVVVAYPEKARSATSRSETHVLEKLSMPLTESDPLTATTREQTLVEIGEA